MRYINILISYILITSMSIMILFNQFPITSFAADVVPDTKKAVAHNGRWTGYEFDYSLHGKYWTIHDSSDWNTSSYDNPTFYYAYQGYIYGGQAKKFTLGIMLQELRLTMNPAIIDDVLPSFWAVMKGRIIDSNDFAQGGIYGTNGEFLGYAMNDITGCALYTDPVEALPDLTMPNDYPNDIKNFVKYYNDNLTPDYFTFYPCSDSYLKANITGYYTGNNQTKEDWIVKYDTVRQDYPTIGNFQFWFTNDNTLQQIYQSYTDSVPCYYNDILICTSNDTNWSNFCNLYGITQENTNLRYTDIYSNYQTIRYANYNRINFESYTDQGVSNSSAVWCNINSQSFGTNGNNSQFGINSNNRLQLPVGSPITIYRNFDVYKDLKIDNDYKPNFYIGTGYFDSNNTDNSITITDSTIDNSITNNETIFNEVNQTINETTEGDNNYDNSVVENITETIINIYYPEDTDNPTDPDNPTNPDNPIDPDNPSGILDAILDALGRFFTAIGKILAAILAGLLEVVDSILEAIAGIMENFTGVTEFISALFSWLPDPVPQVLAAALSVAILFALIRFIRG